MHPHQFGCVRARGVRIAPYKAVSLHTGGDPVHIAPLPLPLGLIEGGDAGAHPN